MHKAIFICKLGDSIQARYVIYNFGMAISPNGLIQAKNEGFIPLEADHIKSFYDSNKDDFTVLKETWTFDSTQVKYLELLFKEVEEYKSEGFSNASEYYYILSKEKELIILNHSGKWKKYRAFNKVLKLY